MAQRVTIWDTVVKESGEFQRARAGGEEASLLGPLMELRGGRQQKQQDKQRDRLPVIVCPSELEFYLDQQESHKQVLTIYNINDFTLHFVLQSNAPRRYAVPEPEGVIYAHCFVDVVVRHREVSEANVDRKDLLRVVIREEGGTLRGIRDVPVFLRATRPPPPAAAPPRPGDNAAEAPAAGAGASQQVGGRRCSRATIRGGGGGGYQVALVAALACLVALVLPLDDNSDSSSGSSQLLLRLSHQQKLVAAYVLGLVTMLLLRQ
ncbi:uncharacterized protein LOC144150983 isoform X1 [Haemaphysalis longicornis]